ncbi:MAG: hypothetical protein RMJ56_13540 [Gemmataceae bacterium]|nr:helicase-associated domain-containing protein [Gemmata sp.]MDW8198616.1 hypothetical protein [Gemmataceae bacterium]
MPVMEFDWLDRCRDTLARYQEPLLRAVAEKLLRPRTKLPTAELLEKAVATLTNAPVIDRRLKELPPAARRVLAILGCSRQPCWKIGHLLTILAAFDHHDGFTPLQTLLEAGLLFPVLDDPAGLVEDFTTWFGPTGMNAARVFTHPQVAARSRSDVWEWSPPATGVSSPASADDPQGPQSATTTSATSSLAAVPRQADGWEWPLRLAVVWQHVHAEPVRLTQSRTLFKRDLQRLQTDAVLASAPGDQPVADGGVLALLWAQAAALVTERSSTLEAAAFPAVWEGSLGELQGALFAALWQVDAWDPLNGYTPADDPRVVSPTPTAGLLSLLLAREWTSPGEIAAWLWSHHPSWAAALPATAARDQGTAWVRSWLWGVAYPLGVVELNEQYVRLSAWGRHWLGGDSEPAAPPAFPQTLMVQPNAEILAYRQGLTPALVASLSRFARWKSLGPACTLELTPEQTYRGLESGLSLPMILQTLHRHGLRPVPPGVADLLQRWASKRERITVFSSAVLVEFPTPAELDAAVARGLVALRLTDRIGMTADGREPALTQFRLIGNRDYEAKPQRCLQIADDGITLTVDTPQADLLLEAEIGLFAEALPIQANGTRQYQLTAAALHRALASGRSLADIDAWFLERAGAPLSPAGRLLVFGPQLQPLHAAKLLVVKVPTAEMADGLMQWPATRAHIAERLGPQALVVRPDDFPALQAALAELGITFDEVKSD